MERLQIARELLKVAKELSAGREHDEIVKKLFHSKDPGVKNVTQLLYSIWNMEKVDWKAARAELLKYPSGRKVVRGLEILPGFDGIRRGYHKFMKTVSREEKTDIDWEWEDFERKTLRPIETEMVEYYLKEGVDA